MKTIYLSLLICSLGIASCSRNSDDAQPTPTKPEVTKSNFKTYHPCGVAVSSTGKVAISTYEGDTADGQIFIWNSFADFNADKTADYQYQVKDPEAVAFDANNNLFIANTYESKIHFTKDVSKAPTDFFYIGNGAASPTNPRGMSFDSKGRLYVMCENLNPQTNSYVQVVENPTLPTRSLWKLFGSDQSASNALSVSINNGNNFMLTTDYKDQSIKAYTLDTDNVKCTFYRKLSNAGGTLDAINVFNNNYFTNDGGYLVKWNFDNNSTKNIFIGTSGIYAPWGIAYYQQKLIVADAAHNKVQVIDPNTATWN